MTEQDLSLGIRILDYDWVSDRRDHNMRRDYGWSRRRLHLGLRGRTLPQQYMLNLRMSHRCSNLDYEGSVGYPWQDCCLWYLYHQQKRSSTNERRSKPSKVLCIPRPSSCMLSFPKIMAPASSHFCTHQLVTFPAVLVKSLQEPKHLE